MFEVKGLMFDVKGIKLNPPHQTSNVKRQTNSPAWPMKPRTTFGMVSSFVPAP